MKDGIDARATVNELLVEIFNHILPLEERYLKQLGVKISVTEIHILENVGKSVTKTMSEVAKLQGVTAGTLTVGVDRLVHKGYLTKNKIAKDKRAVHLHLTALANEVLEIHKEFHNRLVNACVEDLGLENEESVVQGLQKIASFFKDEMDQRWDFMKNNRKLEVKK